MVITVASRHMEISPPLKSYAETKANKLTKYYDRIEGIDVVIDHVKDQNRVEMIVNGDHSDKFIAQQEHADAYAAVDACVDKLERQLTDHKKRLRNRKHPEMQ